MLNALLNDFANLAEHEVTVMLDVRCISEFPFKNIRVISIDSNDNVLTVFENLLQDCDAIWIIAPETENILFNFTKQAEKYNKLLLSSPSSAIAKTADKFQTFELLTANHILTIPTQRLIDLPGFKKLEGLPEFPFVIKPIDGVGCENTYLMTASLLKDWQSCDNLNNFIIQPFIQGDALSISALFKRGQAHLICINCQHIQIKNQQFKLSACEVNIAINDKSEFQNLLNQIAQAFPDLFGYVGIDLIVSDLIYVVEINPRLTSSYSGIRKALGLNIADLVLQSINSEIVINPIHNKTIFIDIAQA
jgi:tyramine---L-glutamate ligase